MAAFTDTASHTDLYLLSVRKLQCRCSPRIAASSRWTSGLPHMNTQSRIEAERAIQVGADFCAGCPGGLAEFPDWNYNGRFDGEYRILQGNGAAFEPDPITRRMAAPNRERIMATENSNFDELFRLKIRSRRAGL